MSKAAKLAFGCLVLNLVIILIIYAFERTAITPAFYGQVLNSGGSLTFDDLLSEYHAGFALKALIGFYIAMRFEFFFLDRWIVRRPREFDFSTPGEQPALIGKPSTIRRIDLRRMSPRGFEESIAWLITARTGYLTEVVGGAGDGGVDVRVYDANRRLVGVVQCKHYNHRKALPPNFVREMATVKVLNKVNIAYLATTARFSSETRRLAEDLGIRLIDGDDLKHIVKKASRPQQVPTEEKLTKPASYPDEHSRVQAQLYERQKRLSISNNSDPSRPPS